MRRSWSAAQAPLLAKIAELKKKVAELESAQPKAEKVEKLVSDDWIRQMQGMEPEDSPTSQALRELLQCRQREERRER